MTDLIDTTEMYLRTIYELIEDGVPPLRARIAEQLGHSGPTVSQTIARMERDGLVVVGEDRTLVFTAEGVDRATKVMRKHRLAERLLTDVIGLDLRHVHEEACRWEHVMSERVERRLVEMLGRPERSPYGNLIPGLDELDVAPGEPQKEAIEPLSVADALAAGVTRATLVRIGENPQALAGFLQASSEIGLLPGISIGLRSYEGDAELSTEEGSVVVPGDVARHLFVSPEARYAGGQVM
ncbi:metal-dependent transcriptional regulator [Demequina sp. TTPB684]|uniref:metal-dependent transcriptional regulator n=1 Tax=unclassified Demequina TaxID=2620311 RepID=UPI001CF47511|nr:MULTISPECIES: metal-dependent transcriptional regulator [unclassified Demequina]MCB2411978.1 metal-dependent transcriptional regulator [Demequina sp. TTPB684]UPU87431.1 metal-dependent transcriptional regulator [Demequina sp. TMPB413]